MAITTLPDMQVSEKDISLHVEQINVLLLEIVRKSNSSLTQGVIRNVVEQSFSETIKPDEFIWHDCIHIILHHLGLSDQLLDCTTEEFLRMAEDGAQIITCFGNKTWLGTVNSNRGQLLISGLKLNSPSEWISIKQLREDLQRRCPEGRLRCVVIKPGASLAASSTARGLNPLQRLWKLLRPEWSDIWIVFVFALVMGLLALATPIAVETLVNTVAFGKFLQPVIILSLMLLTVLAFSAALRALQTFVVEIVQRRLFVRVAADVAHRLPHVQQEHISGKFVPELVNRFFDIVVVQKVVAQLLLDGVSLLLGTVIGMAMLAFYHPWLLGFDVMLLGMLAIIVFVLGRGAVKSSIKESKVKYKMVAWLEDVAKCPTAFRHEGSARFVLEHADQIISDYLTARGRHFRILMRQIVFALGMQAVASTVLLGLGGWLVISGQLTLGQLVAAELIVAVIVGSFAKLGKHMESFYDLLASVDKLGVLFDLPIEKQSGLIELPAEGDEELEIQNLEYKLENGSSLFSQCNLQIQPGDRLAITGTSGSGKSTLLDILFGLRTPTSGQVKLMGAEIRELHPELLRKHVALVREIEVFEGTIAENVRVGRLDITANDIRRALDLVGLLDVILCQADQLDTHLTSTGFPLSNLQLQRLMLARACASSPTLLLLDGTLDIFPDDEAEELLKLLSQPHHPWKLVLVTGRKSLIEICNRTYEFAA